MPKMKTNKGAAKRFKKNSLWLQVQTSWPSSYPD